MELQGRAGSGLGSRGLRMRCVRGSPGTGCGRWEMLGISTASTSGARYHALRCCCSHWKLKHGWLWLALNALLQRSHWAQPRCPVLLASLATDSETDRAAAGTALFVAISLAFPVFNKSSLPFWSTSRRGVTSSNTVPELLDITHCLNCLKDDADGG